MANSMLIKNLVPHRNYVPSETYDFQRLFWFLIFPVNPPLNTTLVESEFIEWGCIEYGSLDTIRRRHIRTFVILRLLARVQSHVFSFIACVSAELHQLVFKNVFDFLLWQAPVQIVDDVISRHKEIVDVIDLLLGLNAS
jgi:hypothetical protein